MSRFISNLHRILYTNNYSNIHKLKTKTNFYYFDIEDVDFIKYYLLPTYFNNIKYKSFLRQLSNYNIRFIQIGNNLALYSAKFRNDINMLEFLKSFKRKPQPQPHKKYDKFKLDMSIFDDFPICIYSLENDCII